jgi:NADH-quinone oxidoreductase subunit M
MDSFNDWALTLAVFIPLVGAVLLLLIPKAEEGLCKLVALVTSVATLAVGVGILFEYDYDKSGLQFAPSRRAGSASSTPATRSASTASRCRC